MDNIPKKNQAKDSEKVSDVSMVELLTLMSIISKKMAKQIILSQKNGRGDSYGYRSSF